MLLPADAHPSEWALALGAMWHDRRLYKDLSWNARFSAAREELGEEYQLSAHEAVMEGALKGSR